MPGPFGMSDEEWTDFILDEIQIDQAREEGE